MKTIGKILLKIMQSKIFKIIFGIFLVLFICYFLHTGCN